jgi:hypothetical protein
MFSWYSGFRLPDEAWRDTNRYEVFYHRVAYLANEPELCAKISTKAVRRSGFNPSGRQIKYVRSQCYYDVAMQYDEPSLCSLVKPISTFFMTGYETSPSNCRRDIQDKNDSSSRNHFHGYHTSDKDILRFFTEMGYEPDTIHLELPMKPLVNKVKEFKQLGKKPDIIKRLATIIKTKHAYTSNKPVHVVDREIFADMMANLTNDTKMCKLIRNDTFIPESGGGSIHTFRNWCIFKIAANTGRMQVCEEISNRIPNLEFPWDTLKATCVFQVKSHTNRTSHYRYFVPKKDFVVQRLFDMLGYSFTNPNTLPPKKIADRYQNFISDLKYQPELKQDPRVKRLLGKIQELPSFTD